MVHRYIVGYVVDVGMVPRWYFAMGVKKGTTSGAWTLLYSQCQLERGPATNIKVHPHPNFFIVIGDILIHEPHDHN